MLKRFNRVNWGVLPNLGIAILMLLVLASCPSATDGGISVELTHTTKEVEVGGQITISAVVKGGSAESQGVTWSSSNEKVATVDQKGVITGVAVGEATISATSKEDDTKSSSVKITVKKADIKITASATEVRVDESITLTATVEGSDKGVEWSVAGDAGGDATMAVADGTLTLTGKTEGTVTVTATSKEFTTKKATVSITIKPKAVTGVNITSSTTTVEVDSSITLTATVEGGSSTTKGVTWSSANTDTATVDENGKVTGKAAGAVNIKATSVEDNTKFKEISITVTAKAPTTFDGTIFTEGLGAGIDAPTLVNGFANSDATQKENTTEFKTGAKSWEFTWTTKSWESFALAANPKVDVSAYDAITFYAKAKDADATIDKFGFGAGDGTEGIYEAFILNTVVPSDNWKQFVIPIPDASKLTSLSNVFYVANNNESVTIYLDDVKFETLGAALTHNEVTSSEGDVSVEEEATSARAGIPDTGGTQIVSKYTHSAVNYDVYGCNF